MNVKLINPFIGATKYIFNVMLGLKVDVGELRARKDFVSMQDKVAAAIPMHGGVKGALVLLFPKDKVVSLAQVLDDTVQSVEQSLDALGELANIITGNAKKEVANMLVEITTPTITIEECDQEVTSLSPWMIIPFESPSCSFDLLISFKLHEPVVTEDPVAAKKEQAGKKNSTSQTKSEKSNDESGQPGDKKSTPEVGVENTKKENGEKETADLVDSTTP